MRSSIHKGLVVLVFLAVAGPLASAARAQETVFNVASPDVLDAGKLYLESDVYVGSTRAGHDRARFFSVRAVAGAGANVEVGLNLGPFDGVHPSDPFVDATFKWRPWQRAFGTDGSAGALGWVLGDNAGQGLRNDVAGLFRNLAYCAAYIDLAGHKTRISAGPYFATRGVFSEERRFGAQVTFEQTIPGADGWKLAADWYSGDGALATAGVIWSTGRSTLYAAYGFANHGRGSDFVTLEYGVLLF